MPLGVALPSRAIGGPLARIDGPLKVTGAARYAYEYPVAGVTYAFPIQSTIAKGRVVSTDARAARALPGVVAVLSHENAPRLRPVDIQVIGQRDQDLAVFQSDVVTYRGQAVAAVVAESLEVARQAASLVTVRYEEQPHDVELRADRGDLYAPETLVMGIETDTTHGDIAAALVALPVSTDRTYTTAGACPRRGRWWRGGPPRAWGLRPGLRPGRGCARAPQPGAPPRGGRGWPARFRLGRPAGDIARAGSRPDRRGMGGRWPGAGRR